MAAAMTAEGLFDTIGVRFNPSGFAPAAATINWTFTDLDERHGLGVSRSAVHHTPGIHIDDADVSVVADRALITRALDDPSAISSAEIVGDADLLIAFFESLDVFTPAALIEP